MHIESQNVLGVQETPYIRQVRIGVKANLNVNLATKISWLLTTMLLLVGVGYDIFMMSCLLCCFLLLALFYGLCLMK